MNTTSEGENDTEKPDFQMEDSRSDDTDDSSPKKDAKEENVESESTGSSAGKSGSGGGYTADCSASDQSSDENGDRKSSLNLSVAALNLHERPPSRSSSSSDGEKVERPCLEGKSKGNGKGGGVEHQGNAKSHNNVQALGIDLPLKSPHAIDLDSMIRTNTEEERENSTALQDQRVLPQWNGVRVAHPMDPRIDLSTVTVLQAGIVPGNFQSVAEQTLPGDTASPLPGEDGGGPFSVLSYTQLMEVVRPFFQSHGITLQHAANDEDHKGDSASDQIDSSEGFTSFFTTTNSGTNSGGTTHSGSPQSSDLDKKPRAVDHSKGEREADNADASSMVVLARVKRKHKKAEDSANSSSSSEKRVRIQDRIENHLQYHDAELAVHGGDANEGSSGSSSVSNVPNAEAAEQQIAPLHIAVPPRIVTDVSSSKMSSATSSNVNTSTSGSGSGGNTGSGSNQGSSGSGNEGKASSEEPAQGDNSGESPVDGSDQSFKKGTAAVPPAPETDARYDEANREKKILDKKRKRIEMRREYEAQQQMESSESSDPLVTLVRPGKPVTMDQVLRFSKIARIVIQASPPFLIVHTNAAFTRLTGIDSHQAVGQTISSVLFLPEGFRMHEVQQQPEEDPSNPQSSDISSNAHDHSRQKSFALERLIATSGHGKIQLLRVLTRPHHMVGRSVTITKDVPQMGRQDESVTDKESKPKYDGSVSSPKESLQRKACRAAIAPIVSMSAFMPRASLTDERDVEPPKPKRRRSHSQENEDAASPPLPNKEHRKTPSKLVVTHFLIQLEDVGAKQGNNLSMGSLSSNSTSVEARLVGLSKEEYIKQKRAASGIQDDPQESQGPAADDEGGNSESTVPEHVSTLG